MSKLIDPSSTNAEVTVDIGNGQLVSMKAVQQIYAEITGKSEALARHYKVNHTATFDDLRQLNAKITQLYEQYNIVSRTCAVTLYHVDDQKQTFSSFDRFELFDRTTLSPVENVRLEYNFLIVLPQMNRPQSYELEINIHSRAAIIKKARAEVNVRSDMFLEIFSSTTAYVEISYVDYTVARNFQVAIDGWFKALPELPASRLVAAMQQLTGYYIFLFRLTSVLVYLAGCYRLFAPSMSNASVSGLYVAAFVTFGGMFLLSVVAGKAGSVAADAMRRIQSKSHLRLTRGDELVAADLASANRVSWLKAAVSLLLAIAANVFSSWLASRVGLGP